MKLKHLLLSFVCLSIVMFSSCNTDTGKKKAPIKKTTSSKKMLPASDYWTLAKDNLGLTTKQVDGIKNINAKYSAATTKLKKAKKWDGKANAKIRTAQQTKKKEEIKKLLGNKLPLYSKFTSKHSIKLAKKKKPSKTLKKKGAPKKNGSSKTKVKKAPNKKKVKK